MKFADRDLDNMNDADRFLENILLDLCDIQFKLNLNFQPSYERSLVLCKLEKAKQILDDIDTETWKDREDWNG